MVVGGGGLRSLEGTGGASGSLMMGDGALSTASIGRAPANAAERSGRCWVVAGFDELLLGVTWTTPSRAAKRLLCDEEVGLCAGRLACVAADD